MMRGSRNVPSRMLNCPSVASASTSTTKSGGVCTPSFTWTKSKKANYGKMTTSALKDGKIFLPLIFFFNRNPGLALPLIALQYHEVRLDFDLSSDFKASAGVTDGSTFKVWANYVYLDTEERRRFAQKGHEYLIEQVQHTGTDTVTAGSEVQKRLSYNHPVKELVFCLDDG